MMHWEWIVTAAAVIGVYVLYVSLIKKKNNLKEAAAGIDIQLKKRYDLIPNLLQTAAKFMEHEKGLMTEITRLRTQALENDFQSSPAEKIALEKQLNARIHDFRLAMENYPDMKSNQTMITAMQSLNEVEEHIAAARRFYNSSVTELKNAVEIFPSSLIAKLIGIKDEMPFFTAEEEAQKPINAAVYYK